jgi:zinc protease
MRHLSRLSAAGALVLSLVSAAPRAQSRPAAAPVDHAPLPASGAARIVSRTLANGLEILVIEDHAVPVVTIDLAVRNGSFTEPPELNGLSHLYEHMFFTRAMGGSAASEPLDPKDTLGISFNGSTKEEVVEYFFTTTTPHFEAAARMLCDGALHPAFDERDFAREREVVIGEMDRQDSNPYAVLGRAMDERLFFKYPSRKEPIGNRETVRGATTDMMRLIRDRYYVPNNSAVIIAGDVKADRAFDLMQQLFGGWAKRPVDPFVEFPPVEHPPLEKSEGAIQVGPIQNVVAEVGWQGPSVGKDNDATYAADVFSFILTQPESRFQRALVDSGLATSVSFGYYTQRNVGPISLLLQTTPDKATAALAAVHDEIAHFADADYFTDEELASAKALLEADDLYSREELSEYVHSVAFWWSSTGLEYFRTYLPHLRATTRADIQRFVNRYVRNQPHVGVALLSADALKTSRLTTADLIGRSTP